ncbi:hypothetical protein SUGI_1228110 [Cryptomeria japonica]|uniref:Uncharacterized protein n=1 Tax=Cryptomeria japonica TaxID=3369 RepID=A0AAD3NQ42_CRYJA|nr:hypothetical protein SUGI_1228110 [Cryptomeria japonica]
MEEGEGASDNENGQGNAGEDLSEMPVSSLVSDAADRDPVSGPENPSEWPEAKAPGTCFDGGDKSLSPIGYETAAYTYTDGSGKGLSSWAGIRPMMQIQLLVVNVLQDMELNMLRAEMLLSLPLSMVFAVLLLFARVVV